jgi:hypothetical protein
MVRRDGVVKILDFGLVKLLGDTDPRLTATGEGVAAPGLDRAGLLAARAGAALCVGALGRTRQALDELKSVLAERRSLSGRATPLCSTPATRSPYCWSAPGNALPPKSCRAAWPTRRTPSCPLPVPGTDAAARRWSGCAG